MAVRANTVANRQTFALWQKAGHPEKRWPLFTQSDSSLYYKQIVLFKPLAERSHYNARKTF